MMMKVTVREEIKRRAKINWTRRMKMWGRMIKGKEVLMVVVGDEEEEENIIRGRRRSRDRKGSIFNNIYSIY